MIQCSRDDVVCKLRIEKLKPFPLFVNKLSSKMGFKGCKVSFSEQEDAILSVQDIGSSGLSVGLDDLKTLLRANLSKSSSCDKVFDESWSDLLTPEKAIFSSKEEKIDHEIPEFLKKSVEKHVSRAVEELLNLDRVVINEREMRKILSQGREALKSAGEGGVGVSVDSRVSKVFGDCEQILKGGGVVGQCMQKVHQEISGLIKQNVAGGSFSKIQGLGSEVSEFINKLHEKANDPLTSDVDTKRDLKNLSKDLKLLEENLKKTLIDTIPRLDLVPGFDDPDEEKRFIDEFMKGGVNQWGHPEFIKLATELPSFKGRLRHGLRELKTRVGREGLVKPKGKLIEPRATVSSALRKGSFTDLFYKGKPPKRKEDVVWLADTSGSMSSSYAFIQPLVDALKDMGLKQRLFLGTEDSVEVLPGSDFEDTVKKLGSSGTHLSQAFDLLKPKVGGFKNKTFIVYSDMGDSHAKDFEDRLLSVTKEGGKVVLLNNGGYGQSPWGAKYSPSKNHPSVVEFENAESYDRVIDSLRDAKRLILK